MRRVSRKQSALLRLYSAQRKVFLEEHPNCARCQRRATEVHHRAGRGALLLDESTWMPACHDCHMHITANPREAVREGWSLLRLQVVSGAGVGEAPASEAPGGAA